MFRLINGVRRRLGWLRVSVEYALFRLRGMKPWTPGYETYRWKVISSSLTAAFDAKNLPCGYGFRADERVVEYPWFMSRLPEGDGRLLDAGSILNHHQIIRHEKLRDKSIWISTLSPEGRAFWWYNISYVFEDMRNLCYRDDYFDYIVCISTLEHVGMNNAMLYTNDLSKMECDEGAYIEALRELRRVLKPGGVLYLTVPFGRFTNHGWFQIFDGEMLNRVIETFGPDQVDECIYQYVADGWQLTSRGQAADATYFDIHSREDYDPDYAAASRAIAALEMIK